MTLNTYNLSTDVGKLRLAIGDHQLTDDATGILPNGNHYTDDELLTFISVAGSWQIAVPMVLRTLSSQYGTMANVAVDGYSESLSQVAANLLATATAWERQLESMGFTAQQYWLAFGSVESGFMFSTNSALWETVDDA